MQGITWKLAWTLPKKLAYLWKPETSWDSRCPALMKYLSAQPLVV